MTKIYNEISIDMNPESSSYGETLHEDSFEHEGPMMLLLNLHNLTYPGGGGYEDHATVPGGFIVETSNRYVFVDSGGNMRGFRSKSDTTWDIAKTVGIQALSEPDYGTWSEQEYGATQEVSPDIEYSDFSKFIDESGDISDREGMVDYLKEMPGMAGKDINALLSTMPNLSVSQGDLKQAEGKYQSDVYGLQSQLKGARQKEQSMAGMTGIYSPTAKGFGGEDFTKGLYSQLEGVQAGAQDQYGLGEEKEQELVNWLASMAGVA